MSVDALPSNEGCVSKRSVVVMGDTVIYASKAGLCVFDGQTVSLASADIISEDEWASYSPDTIHAYYYQGTYIGFYGDGTGGFMFNPNGKDSMFVELDFYANAGWADIENETLYLTIGGTIHQFNDGVGSLSHSWKSAYHRVAEPTNFTYGIVEAESYPLSLKTSCILTDGSVRTDTYTVNNSLPFYLRSGFTSSYWSIELSGSTSVYGAILCHSFGELANE